MIVPWEQLVAVYLLKTIIEGKEVNYPSHYTWAYKGEFYVILYWAPLSSPGNAPRTSNDGFTFKIGKNIMCNGYKCEPTGFIRPKLAIMMPGNSSLPTVYCFYYEQKER